MYRQISLPVLEVRGYSWTHSITPSPKSRWIWGGKIFPWESWRPRLCTGIKLASPIMRQADTVCLLMWCSENLLEDFWQNCSLRTESWRNHQTDLYCVITCKTVGLDSFRKIKCCEKKQREEEFPLRPSGLRIQRCCSCGQGYSCGSCSTPGLGTSICWKYGQKRKKKKKTERGKSSRLKNKQTKMPEEA